MTWTGGTDPTEDALVRRQEEFRRFLVGVAGPALEGRRAAFRAEGRQARVGVRARPGVPAEASIVVSHGGRAECACALRAAVAPERAVVLKRRSVPTPAGEREEEAPLLGVAGPASDCRAITRAQVVASLRADYAALRRARGGG